MTDRKVIALEARLRDCRNVITLGVLPNFTDYSDADRRLIEGADRIYYPTEFYALLFSAIGKPTFPGYLTYACAQDKIRQTGLFQVAGIPHPRTRTFFGRRQQEKITRMFSFPFIAKVARGSAMGRGVRLIESQEDLDDYCRENHAAYIQEFLPARKDVRVVVVGRRAVHAYWRLAPADDFRCNVAAGGRVSLETVPDEAVRLAEYTAAVCNWDDVGIDLMPCEGGYMVIEGNMKYGKEGFRRAGMDYARLMEQLIDDGRI